MITKWPEPIKREGPYRVYKGHRYTVYDDGNSAETLYQTDLAVAAMERLRLLKKRADAVMEMYKTDRLSASLHFYAWEQLSEALSQIDMPEES